MGLDWVLHQRKPKEGFEDRFKVVTNMLQQIRRSEDIVSPELEQELKDISVSCYEAVGAPQVGVDERANEWFRKNCYEPAHKDALAGKMHSPEQADFWKQDFETCLETHKGQHVMELAEQEGGIAAVTGIAVTSIDFRGKVLRFCEGLLEELIDESYDEHTAEESLDYANRLEGALPLVKTEEHKELVTAAITWLRFWGSRGFGWWGWS